MQSAQGQEAKERNDWVSPEESLSPKQRSTELSFRRIVSETFSLRVELSVYCTSASPLRHFVFLVRRASRSGAPSRQSSEPTAPTHYSWVSL